MSFIVTNLILQDDLLINLVIEQMIIDTDPGKKLMLNRTFSNKQYKLFNSWLES